MSSVDRVESVPLLYVEGGVSLSLFYKGSRETLEEVDSLSRKRRLSLGGVDGADRG